MTPDSAILIPSVWWHVHGYRVPLRTPGDAAAEARWPADLAEIFGAGVEQETLEEAILQGVEFLDPLITLLNLAGYEVDALMLTRHPIAGPDHRVLVITLPTLEYRVHPREYLVDVQQIGVDAGLALGLRVAPRMRRAPYPWETRNRVPLGKHQNAPDVTIPLGITALDYPAVENRFFINNDLNGEFLLYPVQEGWLLLLAPDAALPEGHDPVSSPVPLEHFIDSATNLREAVLTALLDAVGNESAALWTATAPATRRGLIGLFDTSGWLFDGETTWSKRAPATPLSADAQSLLALGTEVWRQIREGTDGTAADFRTGLERFLREEIGADVGRDRARDSWRPKLIDERFSTVPVGAAPGPEDEPVMPAPREVLELGLQGAQRLHHLKPSKPYDTVMLAPFAWSSRHRSATQLLLAAFEVGLFEVNGLVDRPFAASYPAPGEIAATILTLTANATLFPPNLGWDGAYGQGAYDDILYPDADERFFSQTGNGVLRGGSNGDAGHNGVTFCSGVTFEVFMRSWEDWCDTQQVEYRLGGLCGEAASWFATVWYNGFGVNGGGPYLAAHRYGLGVPIVILNAANLNDPASNLAARVLPGDVVQLARQQGVGGSGHAVIFREWRIQNGAINGIRYWSSQTSTNGIAEQTEGFTGRLWSPQWEIYVFRPGRV